MTFRVRFTDGPLDELTYRANSPVATLRFQAADEDELPGTYMDLQLKDKGYNLFQWVPDE